MQVELKDIISKTLNIEEDLPAALFAETDGLEFLCSVKVRLQLSKSNEEVSVRGSVETRIALSCSRCLENFPYQIDTDVDIVCRPVESGAQSLAGLKELLKQEQEVP